MTKELSIRCDASALSCWVRFNVIEVYEKKGVDPHEAHIKLCDKTNW